MNKVIVFVLVLSAVIFAGCATSVDLTTNKVGWSNYADISAKDFDVVGIISLESQEVYESSPFGFTKSLRGSRIVWSDLMAEAARLGADDVINIRIETTDRRDVRSKLADFFSGYSHTYYYKATGLAIKYTGAVDRATSSRGSEVNLPSSGPQREFIRNTN